MHFIISHDARCVPDTVRHHADVSGHSVRDDRLLAGPVLGGRTADAVAGVSALPWYGTLAVRSIKMRSSYCIALDELLP